MKYLISTMTAMLMLGAPLAGAQGTQPDGRYSVKANASVGLGNAYSGTSSVDGVRLDKSGNTAFGVDFRYRFWQKEKLSLGINGGVSYSTGSQTLRADALSFNYAAGAEADQDGDTYQRYTTIDGMSQKITLGEMSIPVYVDLNWQFSERVSLYANAGLGFRISTTAKVKSTSGTCDVYGIYPRYDNLRIDEAGYNDFGQSSLDGPTTDKPQANSFTLSLRAGAGVRVWLYGPLSLECGLNYDRGFMDRLKAGSIATGATTADAAPVTYTVATGRRVRSLTSALGSDKLSALSLNIGLIVAF